MFALALCGRHFRLEFLGASIRLVQGWPCPGEVLLLGQQMPDENRELARGDHGGDLLAARENVGQFLKSGLGDEKLD